jgi:Cu(I)/Ag(I) efflux system membrane protein CusA/SilA
MESAQRTLSIAAGGENVTTTIQGRERYPVNVRYLRDYRSDFGALGNILVASDNGASIPLSELATVRTQPGPAMIRDEDGMLTGYVFVDIGSEAPVSYVERARRQLASKLQLPAGYAVLWTGEYESAQRVRERLMLAIPLTAAIILALLYCNTRSMVKTMIVVLAVPFSAVGAIWAVYLLGYHMSVAVWVGIIALLGIDAETGTFMLLYLDLAFQKARSKTALLSRQALYDAIAEGAAKRLRPKLMTFATMFIGLVPVLWSTGAGSGIMKRVAAPMVGGIVTSFLLELLIYPAIYAIWKEKSLDVQESAADAWEPSEYMVG